MGLWDEEKKEVAKHKKEAEERAKQLEAEAKERAKKAQKFIDEFLIPKFKELHKLYPTNEVLEIFLRGDGPRCSYVTTPGVSYESSYWRTEDYIKGACVKNCYFDKKEIAVAVTLLREKQGYYEIEITEKSCFVYCEYDFRLKLGE